MIEYKIISDINEAKDIWDKLSYKEELYDEWDFRYAYYKFTNPELYFVTGFVNDSPVSLLPLQWNETEKYLEFFGGQFMSYNCIFIKNEYQSEMMNLINHVTKPMNLRWMRHPLDHQSLITEENSTYTLNLDSISNIDEYFDVYWKDKGRNRRKVRQQFRRIDEALPQIDYNNFADIDILFQFNINRFGNDSLFNIPYRKEFFKDILNSFNTHMISIRFNNELEAVSLNIFYKNRFYCLNAGISGERSNLGKYIYTKNIEHAITLKSKVLDALEGEYGWKDDFGFLPRPQYYLDLRNK